MGAGLGSAAALIVLALIVVLLIRRQRERREVAKRSRIATIADSGGEGEVDRDSDVDLLKPYVYQPPVEMDAIRRVNEISGSPVHELVGSRVIVKAKTVFQTSEEESHTDHNKDELCEARTQHAERTEHRE